MAVIAKRKLPKVMTYGDIATIHNRIVQVLNSEALRISKKKNYSLTHSIKLIKDIVRDIVPDRSWISVSKL